MCMCVGVREKRDAPGTASAAVFPSGKQREAIGDAKLPTRLPIDPQELPVSTSRDVL